MSTAGASGGLELEDNPCRDAPGLDVGDRLVVVVQRPGFADHVRLAGGVQLEDLADLPHRERDRGDVCPGAGGACSASAWATVVDISTSPWADGSVDPRPSAERSPAIRSTGYRRRVET